MFAACSTLEEDTSKGKSAEELFSEAKAQMDNVSYEKAIKAFETLQSRYPYGPHAQQAQLEIAYAYYKHEELESALVAADRFIKLYPNNQHVDYAYYLKGLINFNEELGVFGDTFQPSMAERDPQSPRESFEAFKDLITRFPDSKYAPDAKVRMQYLINTLAKHDLKVASYYLRRGAYVAAVNRANSVLSEFPQTPATRDALQIMIQAYAAMGLNDLRDDTQRVLDLNIAKDGITPFTKQSPENKKHWWQFWKAEHSL